MSNTFSVTLPSGEKVLRTSVRTYTHAVAYRATDPNEEDGLTPWALDGFRSSERLATYQAGRRRNQGIPEVVVLPVDPPTEFEAKHTYTEDGLCRTCDAEEIAATTPAPVQYLQNGKLVDGFGNIIAENVEATSESWDEATTRLSQEAAIESALDDAVDAFLGGRQVTGRSWSKIRESLRPAIVAAAPHLQSPAWERGYEDRGTDEALSDLIEAGAAQPTTDPFLKGAQR